MLSLAAVAALPVMPAYSISKAAAFSLSQSQRALFARQGVTVHAVLNGPADTDMSRDLDVPKASPASVARAILDGVEHGEEEIFPDAMSASIAGAWRSGALKTLEVQNACAARARARRVVSSATCVAARRAPTAAALTTTLGLAAVCWVVAIRQMRDGMDMGVATRLGSFEVLPRPVGGDDGGDDAAGHRPGGPAACSRRAATRGRSCAFVGSYLAVWALVGVAVYALYRPHGTAAAGAIAIAAGVYELTPLKRRFRRRCQEADGSGVEHGLACVGSSIGLMLVLVAVSFMSIPWMAVIAAVVIAQKLLPGEGRERSPRRVRGRRPGSPDRARTRVGPRTHTIDVTDHEGDETMTDHTTGTHEEWLAARLELLEAEKALTRRSDEVARQRRALPWVRVDKEYRFDTEEGTASLADLFQGRSQLLVYHFMFGPDYEAGCLSCSAIADGFDGSVVHLAHHDVTLYAVSRAPLAKLLGYRQRMGWSFPWASSGESDFNYDFHVTHTEQEWDAGAVDYNFRSMDFRPPAGQEIPILTEFGSSVGTDWKTYRREGPGVSAFALEDGVVYHTYSSYERGIDNLWGMYQWLDRTPLGRNETGLWWRRHDEYVAQAAAR